MSADVHAVSNALNAGSKAENLVMTPAAFFMEAPTPAGMEKARQLLSQRAASGKGTVKTSPEPTPAKAPEQQLSNELQAGLAAVVEHQRREGFDARLGPDCAYLGIGQAALVIPWSQLQSRPAGTLHSAVLQVALRIKDEGPLLFHDVITHLAASREEAVMRALLQVWLHGDLPPILPLIGGPKLDDVEVFGKDSEFYCPPWIIYSGPYQMSGRQGEKFVEALRKSPPLFRVREMLAHDLKPGRMHWMKLFRCRDEETGSDQADCLVDGELSKAGAQRLMEWEWPAVGGRHLFRQFLVLLPEQQA